MARAEAKAEFEVISGPMDGHVFSLSQREFNLGRGGDNEIQLSFDRKVKEDSHLDFWTSRDGKWYMRNNDRSVVLVDGEKAGDETRLSAGQIIKVGETELLVTGLEPQVAAGKKRKRIEEKVEETIIVEGYRVCPKCETSNDGSAKWCKNCGYTLLEQTFQG